MSVAAKMYTANIYFANWVEFFMPRIKLDAQNPESLKMSHLYDPQRRVEFIRSKKIKRDT